MNKWENMDLKELEEFNNGAASVAFYLPLLIVQFIGLFFYPLVVLVGVKSFSDYLSFIGSVVKNTWEVPWIILKRLYAIGWNGVYILWLAVYTLF